MSSVREVDVNRICISYKQAHVAISKFFNTGNYKDYTIVVSVGSVQHEGCLFVRKINGDYRFVLYNPNFESVFCNRVFGRIILNHNGFTRTYSFIEI